VSDKDILHEALKEAIKGREKAEAELVQLKRDHITAICPPNPRTE
jgi:vacuolar-type H+-ATPase subunit H